MDVVYTDYFEMPFLVLLPRNLYLNFAFAHTALHLEAILLSLLTVLPQFLKSIPIHVVVSIGIQLIPKFGP